MLQTKFQPSQGAAETVCKAWACKPARGRSYLLGCTGTTSQPCMGALVHALAGGPLDTGLDPANVSRMSTFWEVWSSRLLTKQVVFHHVLAISTKTAICSSHSPGDGCRATVGHQDQAC